MYKYFIRKGHLVETGHIDTQGCVAGGADGFAIAAEKAAKIAKEKGGHVVCLTRVEG